MASEPQMLAIEQQTFELHKNELLQQHYGKYALIKGEVILTTIDTQSDAISIGYFEYGNVPFLVKQILPIDRLLVI